MGLNSAQNDGWEVYARKPKNKGGKRAGSSQEYFPLAADYDKAVENDVEDNELDFIDESDDDLQYDDFDSDVTETIYEMRKKNRELAEHLEEELRQRGTSVVPPSEMYGKRDGVEFKDKEIVWPPMVVIMNTRLDKDENDKDKEIEEFMEERATLVQTNEYRIAALRCKHWEQEVEPERKIYLELAKLMEKYSSK
ncbi:hypothetical protein CQW23_24252 [Capsicum baccatum]|uniref:Uncharacterized protein n=1 Tax=Capsicum baccatum TaxID=33114 RepID=A0A2G2VUB7_CAPBA|nr:hypothetical protein CQW23_24252 [Capsicum baccatum]